MSGLGWSGPPSVIVDAVLAGELLLVSSPPLLSELERVLAYPKLARVFPDPAGIVGRIRMVTELVEPAFTLAVVTDEPDNRVLEAAVDARVEAIVTGDGGLHPGRPRRHPDHVGRSVRGVAGGHRGVTEGRARPAACRPQRSPIQRGQDPGLADRIAMIDALGVVTR